MLIPLMLSTFFPGEILGLVVVVVMTTGSFERVDEFRSSHSTTFLSDPSEEGFVMAMATGWEFDVTRVVEVEMMAKPLSETSGSECSPETMDHWSDMLTLSRMSVAYVESLGGW